MRTDTHNVSLPPFALLYSPSSVRNDSSTTSPRLRSLGFSQPAIGRCFGVSAALNVHVLVFIFLFFFPPLSPAGKNAG